MRYTVEKVPDIGKHLTHERKIMTDNVPAKAETWAPNEAPTSRWVGFFFACFGAMIIAEIPFSVIRILWKADGAWAWLPGTFTTLGGFALTFALQVLFLRLICKTSLRDLVLGAGEKIHWDQCGKMIGAWFAGLILNLIFSTFLMPNGGITEFNSIGAVPIFVNFLLCLALVWMQTTSEEIVNRCIFLRATCGNKIRITVKSIVWGVVSTLLFMAMHCMNPEVLSQGGGAIGAMALASYFIAGFGMYMADAVYGNCMPGCVIHWINNFFLFVFFTQANSAVQSGSLFVSNGSMNGVSGFIGNIVLYIPIFVVLFIDARKKKAQQAAA